CGAGAAAAAWRSPVWQSRPAQSRSRHRLVRRLRTCLRAARPLRRAARPRWRPFRRWRPMPAERDVGGAVRLRGSSASCTRFRISFGFPTLEMKPTDRAVTPTIDNTPPNVPVPDYRPVERFWPYVDLPEQPTDEELAALNPELSEALFGTPKLPFSISIDFPRFDGPDYARALEMARAASEYRELGPATAIRHRARF